MDYRIRNRHSVYRGFLEIDQVETQHTRYDGSWSEWLTREVVTGKSSIVNILPYDPKLNAFLLIEQYRVGAAVAGADNPWLTECVSGYVDSQETSEQAAMREPSEECGVEATQLDLIHEYWSSPGVGEGKAFAYLATVDATKFPEYTGAREEHEDIRVCRYSYQEFKDMVRRGKITHGALLFLFYWFDTMRRGKVL